MLVLSSLPGVALLSLRECFEPPSLVRQRLLFSLLFSLLFAVSRINIPLALPLGWPGGGRKSDEDMSCQWRLRKQRVGIYNMSPLRCLVCGAHRGWRDREAILISLDGGPGKDGFALCV